MKQALSLVKRVFTDYDHSQQEWTLNGTTFKTLWVPVDSSNRTAAINLNHGIRGFNSDILLGYNGNCQTNYVILPIPTGWTEDVQVAQLAQSICTRIGKTSGYRALKGDDRLPVIIEELTRMAGNPWSDAIYGDLNAIDLVPEEVKLERLGHADQELVKAVVRLDAATGLPYVNKSDAAELKRKCHRYPKGHYFAGQPIGVSFTTGRLYRYGLGKVTFSNFNAPVHRTVECDAIHYYDHSNGDRSILLLIGKPSKAIVELDSTLNAIDAKERAMVEQTFERGIRVSRPYRPTTTVHSREELMDLLPTWGLSWNAPSQKCMDTFLATPQTRCELRLPNSGPVSTILERL